MRELKLLCCVLALFAFSSCLQDDLDTDLVEKAITELPKTRNEQEGYYHENEQPIYKLLNMPVYIINRGNSNINGTYLTANSNSKLSLEAKNSSKKQKWIIDLYDKTVAYPAGGSDGLDALVYYGVYSFDMTNSKKYLGIENVFQNEPYLINKDNNNKYHQWHFWFRQGTYAEEWFPNGYMQISLRYNSSPWKNYLATRNAELNLAGRENIELWEIQPAENFRLNKLTWILEPEDVIKALPTFMDQVVVTNNSAVTANMTATFNKKASETSTFNKSIGSQIQVHTSAKVGVPVIASTKIDITNTTSANWQWGDSETHEDSRTYSFSMTIPPYTSVTAKIMVQMSQLSASYVADFIGEISGRPLRISGKWEGAQAGNIYYEIVDNNTKKILKSFNGIPKSIVDF